MKLKSVNIAELQGKVFSSIIVNSDKTEIIFDEAGTNILYKMYHDQDCCEVVEIEDICGDLKDLVDTPIIIAEERTSEAPDEVTDDLDDFLWTFYTFHTIKGSVNIRWLGSSNGYYAIGVDLIKGTKEEFDKYFN